MFEERASAPHCDNLVLHAPKECTVCDYYPDYQQSRIDNKINFTGHYDKDKSGCPSEQKRSLENINKWWRNTPKDENWLK